MLNNINNLDDWMRTTICPSGVVYSTAEIKQSFKKNNLTPSEFFRPFSIKLTESITNINNSYVKIPPYKYDLYDKESFKALDQREINEYIIQLLTNKNVQPDWKLNEPTITKNNYDYLIRNVENFGYPWCNELEKLIIEFNKFNEYEMYQQPLVFFYICGLTEDPSCIKEMEKIENFPDLLKSHVYEKPMANVVVIINDKSSKNYVASKEKIELLKKKFSYIGNVSHFLLYIDMNTDLEGKNYKNSELFKSYFHKCDIYNPKDDSKRLDNVYYGSYVSDKEIADLHEIFDKIYTNFVYKRMANILENLKNEVEKNKSLFGISSKIEIGYNNVKKLAYNEKKKYLYGAYLYYIDDYKEAFKIFKDLSKDIKKDSSDFFNSLEEFKTLCSIKMKTIKKFNDLEVILDKHLDNTHYLKGIRWFILILKYYEFTNEFEILPDIICKILNKKLLKNNENEFNVYTSFYNNSSNFNLVEKAEKTTKMNSFFGLISSSNTSSAASNSTVTLYKIVLRYYLPMLYEKISLYYLIKLKSYRKFLLNSIISSENYNLANKNLYHYAIFNYVVMRKFIIDTKNSYFLNSKKHINSQLGNLCHLISYTEGAFYFYRNSLELSKIRSKNIEENRGIGKDQKIFLEKYLEYKNKCSVDSLNLCDFLNIYNLNNIPTIDKKSLLFIECDDYTIMKDKRESKINVENYTPWKEFLKYDEPDSKSRYCYLNNIDRLAINSIDNSVFKFEQFSNYNKKKKFRGHVGEPLFVFFNIKNPLFVDMELGEIKLICEFQKLDEYQEYYKDEEEKKEEEETKSNSSTKIVSPSEVNSTSTHNQSINSNSTVPSSKPKTQTSSNTLSQKTPVKPQFQKLSSKDPLSSNQDPNNPLDKKKSGKKMQFILNAPKKEPQPKKIEPFKLLKTESVTKDNMIFQSITIHLGVDHEERMQLFVKAKKPGKIIVKGVEMLLNNKGKIVCYFRNQNSDKMYSYYKRRRSISIRKSTHGENIDGENRMKTNDWVYDVLPIDKDLVIDFPIGKECTCYKYELFYFPLTIMNNSNEYRVKKFTVYINENEKVKGKKKKSFYLNNYFTINKKLNSENRTEKVFIPFYPDKIGVFRYKIIVKFEEESKLKNIEIKRFLIELKVLNSIQLDLTEEIEKLDETNRKNSCTGSNLSDNEGIITKTTSFRLRTVLSNKNPNLININLDKIYLNKRFKFISKHIVENAKVEDSKSGETLNEDKKNELKLHNEKICTDFVLELKRNYDRRGSIDYVQKTTDNNYYEFPDDEEFINQVHVKNALNDLLKNKQTVLFKWNCLDKNTNKEINGIFVHNIVLKNEINSDFLRKMIKNSIKVDYEIINIDENDEKLINLKLSVNKKSMNLIKNIYFYEFYVDDAGDNDNDLINWIGIKNYKVPIRKDSSNKSDGELFDTFPFNCICKGKGKINLNYINVKIYLFEYTHLEKQCFEIKGVIDYFEIEV